MDSIRTLIFSCLLTFVSATALASDHADPFKLSTEEQAANITGLFFFPKGDQYILILSIRSGLTAEPPYLLEPFEFFIHMDTHSEITFDNAEDKARYGGTIKKPEGISPDVTLKILLNNDVTVKEKSYQGLRNPENIKLYTGVRDDPFIFPASFNVNGIAIVLSIPKSSFEDNQKSWLLWAASKQSNGKILDLAGRANRSQQNRFNILNSLPPNEHVAALKKQAASADKLQNFLQACLPELAGLNRISGLAVRHYDYVPDVMIFTTQHDPGFPNGRRLEDDVSLLTCNQGDCSLQETAFIESTQWPRATANDKPFLAEFPYLPDPWPPRPQPPVPSCLPYILQYIALPLLIAAALLFALVMWCRKNCRKCP